MEKIYSLKEALRIMQERDKKGKAVPFSARFLKKNGGVSTFNNAVCSSSYHKGNVRIYSPRSGETRAFPAHHLIELNGKEVRI